MRYLQLLVYFILTDLYHCKKNVLFLVADDLRPQLGAYFGKNYPPYQSTRMHTPNIDKLASGSLLLERSYAQQALCGPSRASFLTSRRPDTTRVYKCVQYFRQTGGNFTTLPQYFKKYGYRSVGMGKIFHVNKKNGGGDDPISWSEAYFHGNSTISGNHQSWRAIPDNELKETPLIDEQTANHAVKTLQSLANYSRAGKHPFFMAVGFRRPHLPFVFPKSYLQLYPSVELPENPYAPVNMPDIAWQGFSRLRNYDDTKIFKTTGRINATKTFPNKKVIELRRAYYSCVSWVDALIGRVLSELERLGLSNNTIVSFIGDHGFHLGEHGLWLKQTNFELSTHAPMMIRIPGVTDNGIRSKQLSELVDLFPTLVDAAGLPQLPLCPVNSSAIQECREGKSLLPLIKQPNIPIKEAAFSQFPRGHTMGYSLRTDRYRYTEWPVLKNFVVNWSNLKGVELYDHLLDPEENVNQASNKKYKDIVKELSKRLRAVIGNGRAGNNYNNPVTPTKQTISLSTHKTFGEQSQSRVESLEQLLSEETYVETTSSQNVETEQEVSDTVPSRQRPIHMKRNIQELPQKTSFLQELSSNVFGNIWLACTLATVAMLIVCEKFRVILSKLKYRHG